MKQARRTAVILAPRNDVHALTVAWEVDRLGGSAVILDTAAFPTEWQLSLSARSGGEIEYYLVTPEGQRLDSTAISGLWWRRVGSPAIPGTVTDPRHRDFCRAEARALLDGWAHTLGESVINPLAAELPARRKPYQLAMASRLGLAIPETIVTNDPKAATAFASERPSRSIYKILTSTSFQFTETRALADTELETLDLLNLAPVIFQERIDGTPDIRVTIVDDQVFAAELTPQHPEAKIDWRLDMAIEARPHRLPAELERQLTAYQRAMGLRYGAYDLRRDGAGRYVFFEVNPAGQFLFAEIQADLSISRAVAEGLLRGPVMPAR